MSPTSPWMALLLVLLALAVYGAVVVAAATAVGGRFGRQGLFVFWLASTTTLTGLAGWWFLREFPVQRQAWSVFLTPFLFLGMTIGAVAWYLARTLDETRRGWRFATALLVFLGALIPAAIVSQIPDLIYFNTPR